MPRKISWTEVERIARPLLAEGADIDTVSRATGVGKQSLFKGLRQLGLIPPPPVKVAEPAAAPKLHRVRPSPYRGEPISHGGSAFERAERERIKGYVQEQRAVHRKVLSEEERAAIAAENRNYVPITLRVQLPCRRRRGWSAMAPVSGATASDKVSPTS